MSASFDNLSITFDLDGTLVDTAHDLVHVLNLVIKQDGLKNVNFNQARLMISHGSMAMIKWAYIDADRPLTQGKAFKLQKEFLRIYFLNLTKYSKPYPGVPEILSQLKRSGARLSICTNKPGFMARPLLTQLGLAQFFDRIIGSDDGVRSKPAPDHIFTAVGHRKAQTIVMVGDDMPDALAAKAAKVPFILCSYGYTQRGIYTFGADAVLRNFRELPSTLKGILGRAPCIS
ncbi:MAG: HAD-IA family hydrolase [Robiginitomaculum sp.]